MKSKIRQMRQDNTMVVDYINVKKPFEFRFNLLSRVLQTQGEAIMFINTNTKTEASGNMIEEFFEANSMKNSIIKIKPVERTIFGLSIKALQKKVKLDEKFIIAEINYELFTKEFFESYIATYDIAMGFGSKKNIKEITEDYREGIQEFFFDKEFFKEFLYDSILFKSCRSTINIKEIVPECEV